MQSDHIHTGCFVNQCLTQTGYKKDLESEMTSACGASYLLVPRGPSSNLSTALEQIQSADDEHVTRPKAPG